VRASWGDSTIGVLAVIGAWFLIGSVSTGAKSFPDPADFAVNTVLAQYLICIGEQDSEVRQLLMLGRYFVNNLAR